MRPGQVGQDSPPGGDAVADQHTQPERERATTRMQSSITQLLITGVKTSVRPAAGSTGLARIQTSIRFSSRGAR
jgi:hypothetical protein